MLILFENVIYNIKFDFFLISDRSLIELSHYFKLYIVKL